MIARIAPAGQPQHEFTVPIITPFVIPTVLASLWAITRYPDDWSLAVTRVIRLGGDVDTLAAIVGAVLGARLGARAIPPQLANPVLHADRIRVSRRNWQPEGPEVGRTAKASRNRQSSFNTTLTMSTG